MLSKLILINIGIFALQMIFDALGFLITGSDFDSSFWFTVPADLGALIYRPWSVLTYMFFHHNFLHIFFNLMVLFFGGQIFSQFIPGKKILSIYLLGGFAGAALYIAAYNIFPVLAADMPYMRALGASASVMAVFVAIAAYQPNYKMQFRFIGDIPLKYVAMGFILLDFINIKNNTGGHIAHLGGAIFGYLYGLNLKSGKDLVSGFERFLEKTLNALPHFKKKKSPLKTVYKKTKTDQEFHERKAEYQKEMDAILDKISRHGYDSLSKAEKDFLFKAGR
jgi:membrane associated rhomboid family serine protease